MQSFDTSATREIIDDFAEQIQMRKDNSTPSKAVINFRNEQKENKERDVYRVPTELLRFRKDNGRIASDVESFEILSHRLTEKNKETQNILRGFLERKDPEKTQDLMKSLRHDGQKEPAIITADGFLINGNRRKMALEKLYEETKDDGFSWMKVVILPGKGDKGGAPSLKEIEKIENRYQLQTEGKAEYYNFDRALSMRRKISVGLSLEEQLRDNPNYANLPPKQFEKEVNKVREEFLKPLDCVDEYLDLLNRESLYGTISTGMADREGKWQAFLDYYKSIEKKLDDEKTRMKLGVEEKEVGPLKDAAFKLIRYGTFHGDMKLIKDSTARKELLKLNNIPLNVKAAENEADAKEADKVWAAKYKTDIIKCWQKARNEKEHQEERDGPLTLLRAAHEKLNNAALEPQNMSIGDLGEALHVSEEIQKRAEDLKRTIYYLQKNSSKEKLSKKYKVR
jgi:hypothetical protein